MTKPKLLIRNDGLITYWDPYTAARPEWRPYEPEPEVEVVKEEEPPKPTEPVIEAVEPEQEISSPTEDPPFNLEDATLDELIDFARERYGYRLKKTKTLTRQNALLTVKHLMGI